MREGDLWVPLASEGELHGLLRLRGVPDEECLESAALLAFLFASPVGAHRLARLVRDAEFELKARLLELESLYDLGLSLGGQLDLSSLADEVLFRSISLTDAGRGTLVLMEESGAVLLERSVGTEILSARDAAAWTLPDGGRIHDAAASGDAAGAALSREKMLAVEISVSGRRLGVLAVADKESRDGRVLHFTPTDVRLLSLFANQAAAAIETARLHKEALEKERIERELELAATIQQQILPRDLPSVPGVAIAARNVPTRQVGGDYFDVLPLSGGRLAFLVADVSGKGIPAALLVSTVHAAVHLQIDEARTISDLVERIDRHLQRYAVTRKFLTAFFGLLDPATRRPAVRLRGSQPRAAAPGRRRNRAAQGDGRAARHVPERVLEGGDRADGEGRPPLRLQRRHHGGAGCERRGVRGPAALAPSRHEPSGGDLPPGVRRGRVVRRRRPAVRRPDAAPRPPDIAVRRARISRCCRFSASSRWR